MVQATMREDPSACNPFWFPYFEAFQRGDGQPMALLLSALIRLGSEAITDYARLREADPEKVMQGWVTWAAKHDFDNPDPPLGEPR